MPPNTTRPLYTPLSQRGSTKPFSGNVDDIMESIKNLESRGNYQAVGKPTAKGQKAYGAYQVMDFNIPSWTKEALGRSYTTQEFLADKDAQDAVARHKMSQSLEKYGNPDDVASVWFTGRPYAKAGGKVADVTGTTNDEYLDIFRKGLGGVKEAVGNAMKMYTPLAQRSPTSLPKTSAEAEPQLSPFFKDAATFGREAVRPVTDPSTIVTPTLERLGVPSGMAVAAGVASDFAAPTPGGKGKAVGSMVERLSTLARNSLANNKSGAREKSLQYFRENPQEITKEPVEVREVDGELVIQDGRHRLEAAREFGIDNLKVVDATPDYGGKPSKLVGEFVTTKPTEFIDEGTYKLKKGAAGEDQLYDAKGKYVSARKADTSVPFDGEIAKSDIKVYRGQGSPTGITTFVSGKYFASTPEFAARYGKVSEAIIPKGSKIFDFDAIKSNRSQTVIPKDVLLDPEATRQWLLKRGYDYSRNTNVHGVEYVKLDVGVIDKSITIEQQAARIEQLQRIKKNGGTLSKAEQQELADFSSPSIPKSKPEGGQFAKKNKEITLYRGRGKEYGDPMTPTKMGTLFGAEKRWVAEEFGDNITEFKFTPRKTLNVENRTELAVKYLGIKRADVDRIIDQDGGMESEAILKLLGKNFDRPINPYDEVDKLLIPKLKAEGYDSVRFERQSFEEPEWMILDPQSVSKGKKQ